MALVPINCPDSGAKPIERSRGDRGTLAGRGRRDRRRDRREDAGRVGSDHSPLHPQEVAPRQAGARRCARPHFTAIGRRSPRANVGAGERAAAEILSCAPANLRGARSGPGLSLGFCLLPSSSSARLNLSAVVGPVVLPPGMAHAGAIEFPLAQLNSAGKAGRVPSRYRRAMEFDRAGMRCAQAGGRQEGQANPGPRRQRDRKQNLKKCATLHQECNTAPICPKFSGDAPTGLRDVSRGVVLGGSDRPLEGKKGV
jgi:hypothetical protein